MIRLKLRAQPLLSDLRDRLSTLKALKRPDRDKPTQAIERARSQQRVKCFVLFIDGGVATWYRTWYRAKKRLRLMVKRENLWATRAGPLAILVREPKDLSEDAALDNHVLPPVDKETGSEWTGWRFLTRRYAFPKETATAVEDADDDDKEDANADWLKTVVGGKYTPTSSMSPEDLFVKLDHKSAREMVRLDRLVPLLKHQTKAAMWLCFALIGACVLMFIVKAGG